MDSVARSSALAAVILILASTAAATPQAPAGAPSGLAVVPAAVTAADSTAASQEAPTAPAPIPLSPMMQEIVAAWDAHLVAVRALEQRLEGATDHREALALQREIEDARGQVELRILRIQAGFARREGRLQEAAAIEEAVASMSAPRPAGEPIERAGRAGER